MELLDKLSFLQDAKVQIVLLIAGFNITITGLQKILLVVKDRTATQADNKAYDILNKVAAKLHTLGDWLTGNKEHK
jgi:hypothetical protein